MKSKSRIGAFIGIGILIGFVIYYIVMTVIDLASLGSAEKADPKTLNIVNGQSVTGYFKNFEGAKDDGPIFTMEHSINGLIPTGKEYFFILYDESYTKALYVRADKDFIKNSKEKLAENNGAGVELTGRIRELRSKIKFELNDINYQLSQYNIDVISDGNEILYLDLTTKTQCVLRIITIVLLAGAAVIIGMFSKKKLFPENEALNKAFGIAAVVMLIAGIVGMIYTMTFLM
jgi:hypothetical protein